MIRGMYEASASMATSMARLIYLGNNLANVSTPGFKQDVSAPHAFHEMLLRRLGDGQSSDIIGSLTSIVIKDRPKIDLSQGMLRETGRPLDLALSGSGFFAVEKNGSTYYTRNGTFNVDATGILRTSDGGAVLGESGPITVGDGKFSVEEDGAVAVNNTVSDHLKLVDFPEGTDLVKRGHSYFDAGAAAPTPTANVGVLQGYLESANVDVVNSMLELLTSRKTYSASQRTLQLSDSVLQKAVTELGRVP